MLWCSWHVQLHSSWILPCWIELIVDIPITTLHSLSSTRSHQMLMMVWWVVEVGLMMMISLGERIESMVENTSGFRHHDTAVVETTSGFRRHDTTMVETTSGFRRHDAAVMETTSEFRRHDTVVVLVGCLPYGSDGGDLHSTYAAGRSDVRARRYAVSSSYRSWSLFVITRLSHVTQTSRYLYQWE